MAATLPAIHSPSGRNGPSMKQHQISSSHSQSNDQSTVKLFSVTSQTKRTQGKQEKELEKRRLLLRKQQPHLSKWQTLQYKNSYKHNLCLDMLQEGYHSCFSELFALIKQQNEEREAAGPESAIWNQVQLENEPEKLKELKEHLTKAEKCARKGNFKEVYKARFTLAKYFQEKGDKWLADHFYNTSLETASKVQDDDGHTAAEGHCNVGLALEQSSHYVAAAENFEKFYELCKGKEDLYINDELMHPLACTHLCRIYTTMAKQYESNNNLEQYLTYLKKACDHAKEAGDKLLEGEASYRLGQAYEKTGDSDTALIHLNGYLETCQALQDNDGIGNACEAIAKAYESQGKIEESIKYLEMFVEVAEKSKNDKAISRACSDLGAIFNSLGRYDQAVEYFNKSYNIARAMNDTETISSSRVLFGVAAAHKMLEAVTIHVDIATGPCIERMIEWKDNRGDEFDKPIPQKGTEVASAPSSVPASASSSEDSQENNNSDAVTQKPTENTEDDKPADD